MEIEARRPRRDQLYLADVQAFLQDNLGGTLADLERIGHGEWSQAFRFSRNAEPLIARFSALDEDFLKDQRVMAYASADLPTPRILAIGRAFDGFYAISELIPGDFIERLDADGLRRVLPSFWRALDAMRACDVSATSGFGVWTAGGDAPHPTWRAALLDAAADLPTKRTYGWRRKLATRPDLATAFDRAATALAEVVDAVPEERHLVHSDLLYFNVLVADDRLTGVIDWGSAMYGDCLWDLAWYTFWQPWYAAWSSIDFRAEALQHYRRINLEVRDFEPRMRCYELAIGLDGMAYQAFTERWLDCANTARRVLRIADAAR